MRIAVFTDSYKPQINGVVTSIETFLKQIRKRGHRVHVIAPHSPGYVDNERVQRMRSFEFALYKGYRIAVPALKVKGTFDIVHVHTPFSVGISGVMYARKNNIPVVGTFHTLFSEYGHYLIKSEKILKFAKKFYARMAWSYLRWFYNKCDYITAPSGHIKKLMIKNGIKKPISVIPTGIDGLKRVDKKKLHEKYKFRNEKIILHVGRVTKEKNILFIIRSLENLLKKENIKFIIVSDGPYRHELENHVKKIGLSQKVIFTGYIDRKRLHELYALADVFVIASKTETQGIVLIEAVANKIPIVALSAPVTGDFLKENNYGLVASSSDFAEKVSLVLRNKEIRDKCVRNAASILKKYDSARCAEALLDIYREALNKPDKKPNF